MASVREKACSLVREMLVSKSSAVITGWMLKKALSLSMVSIFLHGTIRIQKENNGDTNFLTEKADERSEELLLHLVSFLILLFLAAFVSRQLDQQSWIPPRMKKTYLAGLALIPGWAWKDVVSLTITCLTDRKLAKNENLTQAPPFFNAVLALLMAFSAAALQIGAERCVKQVSETSLIFHALDALRKSFGCGVGFAVNNILKSYFAEQWSSVGFQVCYTTILAVIIPAMQFKSTSALESRREHWPVVFVKTIDFLILAGNFVLGWAVKGLVDSVMHPLETQGVIGQLMASLIITVLFVLLSICVAIAGGLPTRSRCADFVGKLPTTVRTAITLTAGMNVGWTWSDFASALFGDKQLPLVSLWVYVFLVTLIVFVVALCFELLIRFFDQPPSSPEAQSSGGEITTELSFTGGYDAGDDAGDA